MKLGNVNIKMSKVTTKVEIHGLYVDDPEEVPEDLTPTDYTASTAGVEFFAVSESCEGVMNIHRDKFKEILMDHSVDPESVVDVQRASIQKERKMTRDDREYV